MRCLLLILLAACGSSAREPAAPTVVPPTAASTQTVSPGVELAEVSSTGFDRADKLVADVAVSPTALTIRGREIVALKDGKVGAADLDGGAIGTEIPMLRDQAASLPAKVVLQVDRTVPYQTLTQVVASLGKGGTRELMFLARSGSSLVGVPIALTPGALPDLVVKISTSDLALHSMSGREGTATAPKLVMKTNPGIDLAQLGAVLAEIRARDQTDQRSIFVFATPSVNAQTILEVFGAVRATPEGTALYPDVRLGTMN